MLKSILVIFICFILLIALIPLTFLAVKEIMGWEIKSVNPNNYFVVAEYEIKSTEDKSLEIQIDVTNEGEIKVKGENTVNNPVELKIMSMLLEKGTYHISSGAKGCSKDTYSLVLKNSEGEIMADNYFTCEEISAYTAYIYVMPGAKIDTKFSPVLVSGDKAESFFQWNLFKK